MLLNEHIHRWHEVSKHTVLYGILQKRNTPTGRWYAADWCIDALWHMANCRIDIETVLILTLQLHYNGLDGVSNHQPHHCLLSRLFGRRSKKTSKLRVTGLCAENSPGTGEFPAQMASNAENISIWWRHHEYWGRHITPIIHTKLLKLWTNSLVPRKSGCDFKYAIFNLVLSFCILKSSMILPSNELHGTLLMVR